MNKLQIRQPLIAYKRDSYVVGKPNKVQTSRPPIDCALGSNPVVTPLFKRGLASYPDGKTYRALKRSIIKRFKNALLDESNIFLTHGSFNGLERAIYKIIIPGKLLGYGPQFNEIPSEFVLAGGHYESIHRADFMFPQSEILARLKNEAFAAVYLDNPNNPTGQFISVKSIEKICLVAKRQGTIIMVDEAYGDYVGDTESAINLVKKVPNLVVARSFSKGFGLPGIRVGYLAVSDDLKPYFKEAFVPFEPSQPSTQIALNAMGNLELLARIRRQTRAIKAYLMRELIRRGFSILPTHPDVSIFVVHKPGVDLYRLFSTQGIMVEPGSAFRQTCKIFDNSYIRLRIPGTMEVAKEIMRRIARALQTTKKL